MSRKEVGCSSHRLKAVGFRNLIEIMNKHRIYISDEDMNLIDDLVVYVARAGYSCHSCRGLIRVLKKMDVSGLYFPRGSFDAFKEAVAKGYYSNLAMYLADKRLSDEIMREN